MLVARPLHAIVVRGVAIECPFLRLV
jgi:hypothetical protein